jgi:hypothetical protein
LLARIALRYLRSAHGRLLRSCLPYRLIRQAHFKILCSEFTQLLAEVCMPNVPVG